MRRSPTRQPVGAYRGAGRPEGNYYMERLVDTAAAEMGIDKIELRRRNHIPEGAMPYKAPNGTTYDSGEFTARARQGAGARRLGRVCRAQGREPRAAAARARHRRLPRSDRPAGSEMGGIRFEPNGDVTIITGTLDYGQGHASPFAQVLHETLGIRSTRSACCRATATS
jgi:carbon-monoxide dehydrogenase large subunit